MINLNLHNLIVFKLYHINAKICIISNKNFNNGIQIMLLQFKNMHIL